MKRTALAANFIRELVAAAIAARKNAYAPYSDFHVGAAVLAGSGRIHTGCNVENASYGATLCAERVAIAKAVSEGERTMRAIAIVALDDAFVPPCGICRQVMSEFATDAVVILCDTKGRWRKTTLKKLLPETFEFKQA
ncbi:cytidine deaminase [bacterium]|nr:cytidine deaminase [bacterium]